MLNIIRNIIAVVVGLFVGGVVNWYIGILNVQFYPLPEGTTFMSMMEDKEAFVEWISSLPQSAFILVLVAHLSMAFVGGWVAAFISKQNLMCVAMIVGGISLLAGIVNMLSIPAPVWMWIEMPLYLVAAGFAAKLELKRRGSSATKAT